MPSCPSFYCPVPGPVIPGSSLLHLQRRFFSAGSQPVISIEFHAVYDHRMFVVIDDNIESDPLNSVLDVIDLDRTGQISSCPSSGTAQSALADERILGPVGQCARAAQLFFADFLQLVFSRNQYRVIAPPVVARKGLLESQIK